MAQSIALAIDDVFFQLKQLKSWLKVHKETGTSGSVKDYNLEITPGPVDDEQDTFSCHSKVNVGYTMTLKITKEANTALIPENVRAINRVLLADPRRGQNAQTTLIEPWEVASDQGREGVEMSTTLTIRILDRGDAS